MQITTTGADIWNASDAGLFAWRNGAGTAEMIVRVDSLSAVHPWAKAGIMFRAGAGPSAVNAFVALTKDAGAIFQVRTAAGGSSTLVRQDWAAGPGAWLKLTRQSNQFSAYYSTNAGASWVLLGTHTLEMGADVRVGFAVSSHDASATTTANFSNVSVVASP
jgi:hypothetical protein